MNFMGIFAEVGPSVHRARSAGIPTIYHSRFWLSEASLLPLAAAWATLLRLPQTARTMNIDRSHLLLAFFAGLASAGVMAMLLTMHASEPCKMMGGEIVRGAWLQPVCVKPLTP